MPQEVREHCVLRDIVIVNVRVTTEALHPARGQLAPLYLTITLRIPKPELEMYLRAQAAYPACNKPWGSVPALPK